MRALLLALLLLPCAPQPDVLLPGHKGVSHELILEWGEDLAAQRFVAHPVRGFNGHHEIERGVPFSFSSKYGTRIYAVPSGNEFAAERDKVAELEWPCAAVPVAEVRSVDSGSPLTRIESSVRVEQVTLDSIQFEVLGERRFDSSGTEIGSFDWLLLVLIAGAGVVLLLVLSRRSRPQATPAVE